MIVLLVMLAYALGGIATYRRTGYALENWARSGHEFQQVCNACMCKCGERWGHHFIYKSLLGSNCSAEKFEFADTMHFRTIAGFFPTIAFWPLIIFGYGIKKTTAALGLSKGTFFVPPPAIETKEERQARKNNELTERIKELEAEVGIK